MQGDKLPLKSVTSDQKHFLICGRTVDGSDLGLSDSSASDADCWAGLEPSRVYSVTLWSSTRGKVFIRKLAEGQESSTI